MRSSGDYRRVKDQRLPERLRDEKHSFRDGAATISMQTDTPAAAIVELVRWIEREGLNLIDIQLKRPTLEDVFIELTGKKLRE